LPKPLAQTPCPEHHFACPNVQNVGLSFGNVLKSVTKVVKLAQKGKKDPEPLAKPALIFYI
jgi:hypothetical protein